MGGLLWLAFRVNINIRSVEKKSSHQESVSLIMGFQDFSSEKLNDFRVKK
jgi:hypothetical protein